MDPNVKKEKRGNSHGWVLPEILIFDDVLNNTNFSYSYFKNYNPILIHNLNVYYYNVSNHWHGARTTQHMIDMWLYKIDLKVPFDGTGRPTK
jgi:hypothetical protein